MTDLRRFEYPLEPIRRQAGWRLDALRARLGALQAEIDAESARVEHLRERHAAHCRGVAEGTGESLDPGARRQALWWLAELYRRVAAGDKALAALRARRGEAVAEYEAQLRKVEALDRHREDELAEFRRADSARVACDADREWLARETAEPAASAGPREGAP